MKKKNLLKNDAVQSLLASLGCIVFGLLVGYIVLLFIQPKGAGKAILTIIENFFTYNRAETQMKYLGSTLVKTAPLLMCSLSILFAYKVGLFNIGAAGQYVVGSCASLYAALAWGWSWLPCMLFAVAAGMAAGAIVGPASPTPWDGGETGAEGSTRGANGIDTNRILREAGLKEFIGCEVETSFMDENSVLNGGTGIAAKNSQNRTFGKRDAAAQRANVYLDAFRVYQPLELENEANYADNEKGLKYAPVYDYVKNSANSIGSEILPNSMVYVEYDGDTGIANIAKYQDRGPQNEVYLTNGNYIGFALEGYTEGKTVMISAKAVAGDPVLGYLDTNAEGAVISPGMKMTEMYYDVTDCVHKYVSEQHGEQYLLVLGNIADAAAETRSILSVSGIKLANGINPATSTQIAADIASLVTLAYQPVEEPVFTPERFELRYSGRALAGWFTRISVKTSTDVDHVSVYRLADDGSLVPVRKNMRPMNSLFTYFGWMDYYAFSLTVRAPRRGMTDTYYIFAYDANGVASEPAIASITGR